MSQGPGAASLAAKAAATRIILGFWSLTSDELTQCKALDETRADLVTVSLRDALEQITSATTGKGSSEPMQMHY